MSSIYIPPGSGNMEIGGLITGASDTSVLYVGPSNVLAQDINFIYASGQLTLNNVDASYCILSTGFIEVGGPNPSGGYPFAGIACDETTSEVYLADDEGHTVFIKNNGVTNTRTIEVPDESGVIALQEWITAQKGAVNGLASLDGAAKVPLAQLPYSVLTYNGTWDASNPPIGGVPTLSAGVGDVGDIYIVNVSGDQDLGNGTETFAVGNLVIYNGSTWDRIGSAVSGTITNVIAANSTIQVDNGTTVPEIRCLSAPQLTTTRKINNVDFNGTSDILLNSTYNNTALTSYTFVAEDNQKIVIATSASTQTLTIPTNASVPFPTGTRIDIVRGGTGKVRIIGAGGVTVNSINSMQYVASQWGAVTLLKTGLNTWIMIGNLSLT